MYALEKATEEGLTVIDPFNDYIDEKWILDNRHYESSTESAFRSHVRRTNITIILLTLRCDVDVINDRHDTLFGGNLHPVLQLRKLSTMVVEEGYDIG